MFQQKRVDYVFMVFDDYSAETEKTFNNRYLIEEKLGYHLINIKHKNLLPQLEKSIFETLEEGGFVK